MFAQTHHIHSSGGGGGVSTSTSHSVNFTMMMTIIVCELSRRQRWDNKLAWILFFLFWHYVKAENNRVSGSPAQQFTIFKHSGDIKYLLMLCTNSLGPSDCHMWEKREPRWIVLCCARQWQALASPLAPPLAAAVDIVIGEYRKFIFRQTSNIWDDEKERREIEISRSARTAESENFLQCHRQPHLWAYMRSVSLKCRQFSTMTNVYFQLCVLFSKSRLKFLSFSPVSLAHRGMFRNLSCRAVSLASQHRRCASIFSNWKEEENGQCLRIAYMHIHTFSV